MVNSILKSSLIQAVFSGDIDEAQTLIIDKQIDVNQQSQSTRFTALHAASHCGHADIVELLCNSGARVNCKDARYLTPLHYACRSKSEVNFKRIFKQHILLLLFLN
jgi:ankyrin repeat protein